MNLSVCLSVEFPFAYQNHNRGRTALLTASISIEPLDRSSPNFCAYPLWLWLSPPPVDTVIHYVLPVFWMTSHLAVNRLYGVFHHWGFNIGAATDVYECLINFIQWHSVPQSSLLCGITPWNLIVNTRQSALHQALKPSTDHLFLFSEKKTFMRLPHLSIFSL